MATITVDGHYLILNVGGVNRVSIPKKGVSLNVDGNYLNIRHEGHYQQSLLYSDVSSPSAASAELLRTAVKNLLIA